MEIQIVTSKGEGSTLLSAFDNALHRGGVSNYNIIVLSSIIPPGSKLIPVGKYITPPAEFGHRLYVVRADMRSEKLGKAIAAGVGWYQLEDGRGFFVEHETEGENEEEVQHIIEQKIHNSLHDMCTFRKIHFVEKKVKNAISTTTINKHPACVLAIAVYQSQGW